MSLASLTGPGLRIDRSQPHLPHQASYPLAIDTMPSLLQRITQTPTPIKGPFEIQLIEKPHERKVYR